MQRNNILGRFTAESGGSRKRNYDMPSYPTAPKDTTGIDLKSVTGQLKSNLWDLFRDSMYSYLSKGKYSEDEFKGFLQGRSFRLPVNLPGDYGIDFDINKPMPHGGPRESGRITLKKEF